MDRNQCITYILEKCKQGKHAFRPYGTESIVFLTAQHECIERKLILPIDDNRFVFTLSEKGEEVLNSGLPYDKFLEIKLHADLLQQTSLTLADCIEDIIRQLKQGPTTINVRNNVNLYEQAQLLLKDKGIIEYVTHPSYHRRLTALGYEIADSGMSYKEWQTSLRKTANVNHQNVLGLEDVSRLGFADHLLHTDPPIQANTTSQPGTELVNTFTSRNILKYIILPLIYSILALILWFFIHPYLKNYFNHE